MKKILAFTLSLILTASAFTGCGSSNSKEKDGKSSSSSSKGSSQSELNDAASLLHKAFATALTNLEENGTDIFGEGYIASDGDHTYLSDPDYSALIEEASNYYNNIDKFDYVVFVKEGLVKNVYVADSMDSQTVGTWPKGYNVSGTLKSVKSKVETTQPVSSSINSNDKEPITEQTTIKSPETSKANTSTEKTFDFTADEFVKKYNAKVTAAFENETMTISKVESESKGYVYEMKNGAFRITLTCNTDGYVQIITVMSQVTVGSFDNANDALLFIEVALSPYIVFNEDSLPLDIISFFGEMTDSSENLRNGSDGKANYSFTSSYGTITVITPIEK